MNKIFRAFVLASAFAGLTPLSALAQPASLTVAAPSTQGWATTNLNVRSGPGANNRVVGTVQRGDWLDIVQCARRWCEVSAPNVRGWASERYISYGPNEVYPGPQITTPGTPRQQPSSAGGAEVSYGNDALLSPEVIAFQQVDARLGYSSATIEYDRNSCAIYRAIAPDGQVYTELLRRDDNSTICRP